MPLGYIDTVRVGRLPAGSYSVAFVAKESSNSQQCVERQRNGNSRTFQVAGAPLAATVPAAGWALYPVPASNRSLTLTVPADEQLLSLQLLDAAGRERFARSAPASSRPKESVRVELPGLPAGTYTLRIQLVSGRLVSQRVLLQ